MGVADAYERIVTSRCNARSNGGYRVEPSFAKRSVTLSQPNLSFLGKGVSRKSCYSVLGAYVHLRLRWALLIFVIGGMVAFYVINPRLFTASIPLGTINPGQIVWAFVLDATARLGLRVGDILVDGRSNVESSVILDAIGVRWGDPILSLDVSAARAALEANQWVESATVEIRMPETIYVNIVERRPIALWQRDGNIVVIGVNGVVIIDSVSPAFAKLPLVVGKNAPEHAERLLKMLSVDLALKSRVSMAVRVSDRRWNLHFDNGIYVRLPADNPDVAWANLAKLEQSQRILERDIIAIDLRFPDKLIVELRETQHANLSQLAALPH